MNSHCRLFPGCNRTTAEEAAGHKRPNLPTAYALPSTRMAVQNLVYEEDKVNGSREHRKRSATERPGQLVPVTTRRPSEMLNLL